MWAVAARLCVYCRRQPAQPPWHPFCSERCKLQDLGKWLDGTYRVPDTPVTDTDETLDEDDPDTHS